MTIALKETNETDYWLRVMWKTNIITTKQAQSLRNDCAQLRRILSAIVKTAKDK